jgi:hypothetical protein
MTCPLTQRLYPSPRSLHRFLMNEALFLNDAVTLADPHGPRVVDGNADTDVVLPLGATVYDNVTFDPALNVFPYAGQVVSEQRWNPGTGGLPNADRIELLFTSVVRQTVATYGGTTYFTLPVLHRVRREQGTFVPGENPSIAVEAYVREAEVNPPTRLGASTRVVLDYDEFGNIRKEMAFTDEVDLVVVCPDGAEDALRSWVSSPNAPRCARRDDGAALRARTGLLLLAGL